LAPVSDALVEAGNENVVVTLVRNHGAEISDDTSNTVIDRFSDSVAVITSLVRRPSFPANLAERLITVVPESLPLRLGAMIGLSLEITDQLIARGQENITLDIADPEDAKSTWNNWYVNCMPRAASLRP
jgi:uncharacterized protein (DUF2336 family)|tara:strand:+ start:1628 stop:2014 length:387 start_codon:yes stop_codon:yes gene_type:complete